MDMYVWEQIQNKDSNSLLEYLRNLEHSSLERADEMEEFIAVAQRAGLQELVTHMERSVKELEKSAMWMRAAISTVEKGSSHE
ncbi:MAG: hypothetical protein ACK5MN_03555 [Lachnospiraceae bacterium]